MGVWRERLRFRRWGKWIVGGAVGMVVLGTVSVEATSTSSFCNSCHIMEPYYTSWAKSAHKNVECVECHIEPGPNSFVQAKLNGLGQVVDDVLHRTSNKPSASVSVLSCTRSGCHTIETLNKKEINNGRFKFKHDKHLGAKHLGVEITCGTCHAHVTGDEHFEVSTNVCVTCHLTDSDTGSREIIGGGKSMIIHLGLRDPLRTKAPKNGDKVPPAKCTTCHEPPSGIIEFQGMKFEHSKFLGFGATCESCHQGVTAPPPPIDDGRCLECHTFGVDRSLEAKEMHKVHTLGRHKIECSSCHGAIRHGANVQVASLERFECAKCHVDQHKVQRANYFNVNPHDVNGDSNPMFLAHVDCTGCHTKPRAHSARPDSGAMVMAASEESCDKCHQAGYGAKMVPLWQNATRKMYDEVNGGLKAARDGGASGPAVDEIQAILDQVHSDGSWGVHNPRHTQQVMATARAKLRELRGSATGGGQ